MSAIPRPDLVRLRHMLDAAQKAQEFMLGRTRNRLIHGYFNVDLDIIWSIVQDDLPLLIDQLGEILSQQGKGPTKPFP